MSFARGAGLRPKEAQRAPAELRVDARAEAKQQLAVRQSMELIDLEVPKARAL